MNSNASVYNGKETNNSQNEIEEFRRWFTIYLKGQNMFRDEDFILLKEYSGCNHLIYYNNLHYLINHSSDIKFRWLDEDIRSILVKYLTLLVSFHFYNKELACPVRSIKNEKYLFNYLLMLYKKHIICLDDIEKVIIRFFDISTYSENNTVKHLQIIELFLFGIKLFINVLKIEPNVLNTKNGFAHRIIEYLNNDIISDINNLFILNKSCKLLNLLKINGITSSFRNLNEIVMKLLLSLYSYNYSVIIFEFLIRNVKNALINYNKCNDSKILSDIRILRNQLDFILKMILKEEKEDSQPKLSCGYVFTDSHNSGLIISNIDIRIKHNTILFSFCQHSQRNETKAILFNVTNSKQGIILISCYILDSCLYIQLGNKIEKSSFLLDLNTVYYVCIVIPKSSILKSSILRIVINGIIEEFKTSFTQKEADLLTLGCSIQYNNSIMSSTENFAGIIGPLLFYHTIFDNKKEIAINKDIISYDKIVYNSKSILTYLSLFNHIDNKTDPHPYEKYLDSLKLFVHPSTVINSFKHKNKYHDNYKYLSNKKETLWFGKIEYTFISNKGRQSIETYPFIKLKTIKQFLNYDGIDFLILNIEYYYTLCRSLGNPSNKEIINNM